MRQLRKRVRIPVFSVSLREDPEVVEGETQGFSGLVDDDYDFWEGFKLAEKERKHKPLSSNPNLPIVEFEIPKELADQMAHWNIKEKTLTEKQLRELIALLDRNEESFSKDEYDMGRFNAWKHDINTGDHPR